MKRKHEKPKRTEAEIAKLVEDNMKLAWFFVAKYVAWHHDEHERLSYALRGLHEAAINWNEASGVPFGTYASMRISWQYLRIKTSSLRKKRGGGVTHFVPLDEELDGRPLYDIIQDENAKSPSGQASINDQTEKIIELMIGMPERERRIIEQRFGIGNYEVHTLEDVSAKLGITRERVRQIERQAIGRLRCLYNGQPFRWNHENQTDGTGNKTTSAGATKSTKMTKQKWARLRKAR